jgi:DNA-binding XRE family transcriptional regulator
MSPEAQKRAAVKAKLLAEEMDLAELRRAFEMSQEELARTLGVGQAAIAKIERRADMYLSTLNRVITAMGGELRIVAQFGDRDVCIKHILLEGGRFGGIAHRRNHSHSRKKVRKGRYFLAKPPKAHSATVQSLPVSEKSVSNVGRQIASFPRPPV